jgi:hypothetical protein
MNRTPLPFAALLVVMTSEACAPQPKPQERSVGLASVAVYALSRGKGVPESAARVFSQAEALFRELQSSQQVVRIYPVERLGIEGERRICAEFASEQAANSAQAQLLKIADGVELLNVVIEPCSKNPSQGERR